MIQIGVRSEPSLDSPESWAVFLFFEDGEGKRTHIARFDTAHGQVHLDRLYREESGETKQFETDVSTPYDAEKYLRENWLSFCQKYADAHGFP